MKRSLLIVAGIFGLGLLSSLVWVGVSHAADFRSGDAPTISKSETVDGSVYIAGRSVTIDGTVKGDVFCAGQKVYVTGTVEGDVLCAGQDVRVTGKVMGDVRVAGQIVDLGADVDGSVTVAGQNVSLLPDVKIGRDLTLGAQAVRVEGQIGRDIVGAAQDVIVNAAVGRDVKVELNNLALEPKTRIGGDLTYRAPDKVSIEDGATIAGKTDYQPIAKSAQYDAVSVKFWSTVYGFASLLLIGLAAILLAPRWFDGVAGAIRTRPFGAFGYGAVALFGVPLVAGLLVATLIGIPLGAVMFLVWVAAMISAMAVTAYAVGWWVVEKLAWPGRGVRLASMVIGLLLMALVGLIPVIGGLMVFVSLVLGLGAMTVVLVNRLRPDGRKAKGAKA